MMKYQLKLKKKDFPWLERIGEKLEPKIDLKEVTKIEVKRVNRSLLSRKGYIEHYRNACGEFDNYTVFFAVSKGQITCFQSSGFCGSPSGRMNDQWDANTIGKQLLDRGIRPEFILECERSDRKLSEYHGQGVVRHFWVIYKLKDFDFDLTPFAGEAIVAAIPQEESDHE